jgi:hypothetical protein
MYSNNLLKVSHVAMTTEKFETQQQCFDAKRLIINTLRAADMNVDDIEAKCTKIQRAN